MEDLREAWGEEIPPEKDEQKFIVNDDGKAEWCLSKIAEETKETQRLINVCAEKIAEYQTKIRKFEEAHENKIEYLQGLLNGYFLTVPHKATKTMESYALPSGKLKLKYPAPKFEVDNLILADYLSNNGLDDYLEVIPRAKWGEFKKTVAVVGDKVVDTNGQIVDGVTVTMTQPEFLVEVEG